MPSSTVTSVALGGLIAAGLLGAAFDRRSVLVVVGAAAAPDLDALLSVALVGTHNALLHTLLLPLAATALFVYDTRVRDGSWLRARYGWWGVRVAWVAIAAYAFAGIGPDLFNIEAANPLYPVHDQFYSVVGKAIITNQEGFVQTFVGVNLDGSGPLVRIGRAEGSVGEFFVASPFDPTVGPEGPATDRRFIAVYGGWQLLLAAASALVVWTKFRWPAPASASPAGDAPAGDAPTEGGAATPAPEGTAGEHSTGEAQPAEPPPEEVPED